jgi:hypothetical protein
MLRASKRVLGLEPVLQEEANLVTSNVRIEFGDFQTPATMARAACQLLWQQGLRPGTIVEPTCGQGVFLREALLRFPMARQVIGVDINHEYVSQAERETRGLRSPAARRVFQGDFFAIDWAALLADAREPLLVIGNPPWVNNSVLSVCGGRNHPEKKNRARLRGIDAITGKSNFDVSEWMLDRLLQTLDGRRAVLAMLCKTRVARAVLRQAWQSGLQLESAAIHEFDTLRELRVAVSACLFVARLAPGCARTDCDVYSDFSHDRPSGRLGCEDGRLLNDVAAYRRWRHLAGTGPHRWRSGIKHDGARVMELQPHGDDLKNGLGERVDIESEHLYPLLKGSRLARGDVEPDRWLVVPQRRVGEDTALLRETAPRTWRYLMSHAERLDRRASSIYRGRPRFSIFGVGDYSFSPWKVAIAGFARRLKFYKLGVVAGRPIVLDDTAYFLPCDDEQQADALLRLLSHPAAVEFYGSLVFWDGKRPITADVLRALDLSRLECELHGASRPRPTTRQERSGQ